MPDWQNPEDYPAPEDLTYCAWAWEFLRRNPLYVSNYQHWNKESKEPLGPRPATRLKKRIRRVNAQALADAAEWGLKRPIDPAVPAQDNGHFVWWRSELLAHSVKVFDPEHLEQSLANLPEGVTLLSFDFSQPVDSQILQIRKIFRQWRAAYRIKIPTATTKAQRPKWPIYLRALDGQAAGKSQYEIATILLDLRGTISSAREANSRRRISEILKAARRLQDTDYRKLPRFDP